MLALQQPLVSEQTQPRVSCFAKMSKRIREVCAEIKEFALEMLCLILIVLSQESEGEYQKAFRYFSAAVGILILRKLIRFGGKVGKNIENIVKQSRKNHEKLGFMERRQMTGSQPYHIEEVMRQIWSILEEWDLDREDTYFFYSVQTEFNKWLANQCSAPFSPCSESWKYHELLGNLQKKY